MMSDENSHGATILSGSAVLTSVEQRRLWVVSESGSRWITATRRFVTELIPDNLAASIVPAEPNQGLALLVAQQKTQQRSIVLWEIDPATISVKLDYIARTSIAAPNVLQLAASQSISGATTAALTELGVTTTINHVEQLPGLVRLIRRYLS